VVDLFNRLSNLAGKMDIAITLTERW